MVEEEEVLLTITIIVHGLVVLMEVIQLEVKELVEEVTVMEHLNLVDLLVEEVVVVIVLTIHKMLEVVEVVECKFNTLEDLEEMMVIIGVVQPIIYIMVVTLLELIVNYGTLRTGK
jgi:MFS superfamily sulfate permease-like transporter